MFVESNRRLFRILLRGQSGDMLRQHMMLFLPAQIRRQLKYALPGAQLKTQHSEVAIDFFVSACISLVTWWVDHEPAMSAADLDALFKRLAMPGFSRCCQLKSRSS